MARCRMRDDPDARTINVTVRGAARTVVVSRALDGAAVAAVLAAASTATEQSERLILDLLGMTDVEGDSLRLLARALRDFASISG